MRIGYGWNMSLDLLYCKVPITVATLLSQITSPWYSSSRIAYVLEYTQNIQEHYLTVLFVSVFA